MRIDKFIRSCIIGSLITGCSVGPDYKIPETNLQENYNTSSEKFSAEATLTKWWGSFDDDELTSLIESAVKNNKDIDVAIARVKQSRASRSEASLDLFPAITADTSYNRTKQSEFGTFGGAPSFANERDIYNAGFDAIWELDFFGRVRRSVEAAKASEDEQVVLLQAVLQSVISEVSRNYFELRGLQHQLEVSRKNSDNQKETVRITEVLVKGGQSTELDTARAESQYKGTLATIPVLETEERLAIHRISVLIGELPTHLVDQLSKVKELPTYNGPITLGDPATLLKRRPDIRASERRLASETAKIGVAMGDYFPKVTFVGRLAIEANDVSDLGRSGTESYIFGPQISWAAFDISRVAARVRGSKGRAEEALSIYEQTVLNALQEVEDSLFRFSKERERHTLLKESALKSAEASSLARTQYQAGLIDFLTVLDSERQTLQAQDQLAKSKTALLTYLVAIYKALGGGWENYEIKEL